MRTAVARQAVPPHVRQKAQSKGFPAPNKGWVTSENVAMSSPATAQLLENWTPTLRGIKLRGGSPRFATIDNSNAEPVRSMMPYIGGTTRELFAADVDSIYDITTPADKDVAPTADVTGQTSGYYSSVNFSTSGGNYMYCVNGDNYPQLYDGSTWLQVTDVSAGTSITGLATSILQAFSNVNVYRNKLVFVEGGTLDIHYLASDSIGGAASTLTLKGVFGKGGSVLFTSTWSQDSGSGLDDKLVIVTTEGEIAIYEGDLGAANIGLVGIYEVPPPMGMNAIMKAGGDLVIATEGGMIPLSAAVTKDPAALSLSAISRPIEDEWIKEVAAKRSLPWEIVKWPEKNLAYISLPVDSTDDAKECFVVNLLSGAWSKYVGWDTRCMVLHEDQLYFGSNDSKVKKAELTGFDDDDQSYLCRYIGAWDHLGSIGNVKTVKQARAIFRTANTFLAQLSGSVDYAATLPSAPNSVAAEPASSLWDVGLWDVALWDVGLDYYTENTRWVSIAKTGFVFAPQIQVNVGGANLPTAELSVFDVTYESGALVV